MKSNLLLFVVASLVFSLISASAYEYEHEQDMESEAMYQMQLGLHLWRSNQVNAALSNVCGMMCCYGRCVDEPQVQADMMYDKNKFEAALKAVDQCLQRQMELYLVGGGVAVMAAHNRHQTHDLDVYFGIDQLQGVSEEERGKLNTELFDCVKKAGMKNQMTPAEQNGQEAWMNNRVQSFMLSQPLSNFARKESSPKVVFQGTNLVVRLAPWEANVGMKIDSWKPQDKKDGHAFFMEWVKHDPTIVGLPKGSSAAAPAHAENAAEASGGASGGASGEAGAGGASGEPMPVLPTGDKLKMHLNLLVTKVRPFIDPAKVNDQVIHERLLELATGAGGGSDAAASGGASGGAAGGAAGGSGGAGGSGHRHKNKRVSLLRSQNK